jgi:hypothetical protein
MHQAFIYPVLLGTQEIRTLYVLEHREFKTCFSVSIPGLLQITIPMFALAQTAAVVIPPARQINRAADVDLTAGDAKNLVNAGLAR